MSLREAATGCPVKKGRPGYCRGGLAFMAWLMLLLAPGVSADSVDVGHLQGLGDLRLHRIEAAILGRPLSLYVRLPADYQAGEDTYPTVYLLDGGNLFPMLAAYHHYLRLGGENPPLIMVGISYGSDTFEGGNYRSTDFTAPSSERDFWGGAPVFQAVFEEDLLPLIEKTYRSDPERRIIFGQSLGGQFVLFSSLTRPGLFWAHIASNPALHRNLAFFMQWRGEQAMPLESSRLFVASAEFDDPQFREPLMQWIDRWSEAAERPWVLESRILKGQTHMSAAPSAFRQGMAWLFPVQAD
jgi:predicted alpha/beta superfamily hydrolase